MIYYAYIRKSEEDKNRQIQSIPKQYEWCKRTAKERGIKICQFFEDSKSGHKLGRPQFKQMADLIEKSNQPIGIITWKISRLARNPVDEGIIKYAFIRGKIRHIIARDREYREGENQIIMGVDFGQATQFSIELSKDVKEAMRKKVQLGYRPVRAPYGYKNDRAGRQGDRKIFIHKHYFSLIQQMFRTFLTGAYSVPELIKKMNEWKLYTYKGKEFSTSTVHNILRNPFYYGEYLWNGKLEKGKHRPMITKDEFKKIQLILNRNTVPYYSKYNNYYSGLIKCGKCSSIITGYAKTKNYAIQGVTHHHYLRCTKHNNSKCTQKQLKRDQLDTLVVAELNNLILPKSLETHILHLIASQIKKEQKMIPHISFQVKQKLEAIEDQIEALTKKLLKGVVSDEVYKQLCDKLSSEKSSLEQQLVSHKSPKTLEIKQVKKLFKFSNTISKTFEQSSYNTKKMILRIVCLNLILDGEKLLIELNPVFRTIKKFNKEENIVLEPQNTRYMTEKRGDFRGSNSIWYPFMDELRTFFAGNDIDSFL